VQPPDGRQAPDGMRRITEAAVLAAIAADRGGLEPTGLCAQRPARPEVGPTSPRAA
jgi:hypothetical protein